VDGVSLDRSVADRIPCAVQNVAAVAQTPEEQKPGKRSARRPRQRKRRKRKGWRNSAKLGGQTRWPGCGHWIHVAGVGWVFRAVGADGSWAAFSTEHQLKRAGHLVTAWLRQEYPEPQRTAGGDPYSSDVEKVQYDCSKEQARVMLVIYYTENNLAGSQQSEQADLKQVPWDPIVPGTQSEFIFHWACGTGSAGPRPG